MTTFRLQDNPTAPPVVEQVKPDETQKLGQASGPEKPESTGSGIKEIMLRGPLSHAYTEALKLLLCKETNSTGEIRQENIQQAIQAQIILDEEAPTESIPEANKGFIYVYDGKKMGLTDLNTMFDDLAAVKQAHPTAGHVSATIENGDNLLLDPHKANSLETLATHLESIGVPLYFSRNATLNGVLGFVSKRK